MRGSPDIFMTMVRDAYQAVYRPRSVVFGAVTLVGGVPVQQVDIVGPDGVPVIASYPMQRQADGRWRIAGCFLSTPEGDNI